MQNIYAIQEKEYEANGNLRNAEIWQDWLYRTREEAIEELKDIARPSEWSKDDDIELDITNYHACLTILSPTFQTGEMRTHYEYEVLRLAIK